MCGSVVAVCMYALYWLEAYKVQACCKKKTVYDRFIKVINKQSFRAKEALVCLCSKFSLLKPNNLVSERDTHICLHVICEADKQSHVYTAHTV